MCEYKVWHWAHKGRRHCDPWWESETEWHRNWKNCFPLEWQEVSHIDSSTGEKHIADIKTPFGLVIEFQHSPIKPEERDSREKFYKKMFWIIDGNRTQTDQNSFDKGLSPKNKNSLIFQINWSGISKLLHFWSESPKMVFFDFGESLLWKLIEFDPSKRIGTVKAIHKKGLFDYINKEIKKFYYRQAKNGILEIVPGISIGPYQLGMTRQEVWAQFRNPITCFYTTKESIHRTDHIEPLGIHVHYDELETCNLIEA